MLLLVLLIIRYIFCLYQQHYRASSSLLSGIVVFPVLVGGNIVVGICCSRTRPLQFDSYRAVLLATDISSRSLRPLTESLTV